MPPAHRPLVAAAGLTLWFGFIAAPGAGAESPQRFGGERTDVVAVEVPVQVVRDGQPVRGLTAADFSVYVGREKQTITGFEAIDLAVPDDPTAPAPAPVPRTARRHFLLLFDLGNSEPSSIVKARSAALRVVERLHPTDLVAVARHSPSKGPQLILGFTSDRRQIAAAITTLGVPELVDRSGDPLNLVLENAGGGGRPSGVDAVVAGEIAEDIDRNANIDRKRQVEAFSSYSRSLADLAKRMSAIGGRKYVVLLSEGFDGSLITGTASDEELHAMSAAVEGGEFWKVDNDLRFGNSKSGGDLERMLEDFRRADCVIQAVDIAGLRDQSAGQRRPNGQDALFAMADQTGGELLRNWNDLGAAMGRMLERTSVTYVLAFQPAIPRDGAYHRIRVEVNGQPRGTRVSARAGFFAPKPYGAQDGLARLFDAADAIMSGEERGDLPVAVLAAPFRGAPDRAYVPVLIEIEGRTLIAGAAGAAGAALPTEIYAYAIAKDGTIGDFFGQTLALDLAKVRAALEPAGLKYFGHLELPPGAYSLRVLVRNAQTGVAGLRVLDVDVPAFADAGPVPLPPLFPEPTAKWLIVREPPRGELKDVSYPFVLEAEPYVPASRPLLPTGKASRLSLVAYNVEDGPLRARAELSDAQGKSVAGGKLVLRTRQRGRDGGPDVIAADFEPTGLPPGEYRLRIGLAQEGPSATFTAAAPVAIEVVR